MKKLLVAILLVLLPMAGDFICLISTTDADGSGWRTLGKSGTWTDGGAN